MSSSSYNCVPAGLEDDVSILMLHVFLNFLFIFVFQDEDFIKSISTPIQNLKITVVPDITCGAGLNNSDFDHKLSPEMEKWFTNFRISKFFLHLLTRNLCESLVVFSNQKHLFLGIHFIGNACQCSQKSQTGFRVAYLATFSSEVLYGKHVCCLLRLQRFTSTLDFVEISLDYCL